MKKLIRLFEATKTLENITYIQAAKKGTNIHFSNGNNVWTSYNMGTIEKDLVELKQFLRVHHSYIINLMQIQHVFDHNLFLKLTDETTIPINRNIEEMTNRMKKLQKEAASLN